MVIHSRKHRGAGLKWTSQQARPAARPGPAPLWGAAPEVSQELELEACVKGVGVEAPRTGFLQGPKRLDGRTGCEQKDTHPQKPPPPVERLQRAWKNPAGLCLRRRPGDTESLRWGILTGSKSQATDGQLCPALDLPAAGSTWPQDAATWEQRSQARLGTPGRGGAGALGRGGGQLPWCR